MQETSRTVCFFQDYMLQRVLGIRSLRDPVSPFNGVLTKPYCSVWSFQNHITSSSSRECIYMHTLPWKVCSDRKQKPCIICTNMTARFLFRSASDWIQKSPLSSCYFPSSLSSFSSCLCTFIRQILKRPGCSEMICLSWDIFNPRGCIYITQGGFACSLKLALHPVWTHSNTLNSLKFTLKQSDNQTYVHL